MPDAAPLLLRVLHEQDVGHIIGGDLYTANQGGMDSQAWLRLRKRGAGASPKPRKWVISGLAHDGEAGARAGECGGLLWGCRRTFWLDTTFQRPSPVPPPSRLAAFLPGRADVATLDDFVSSQSLREPDP